MEQPIDVAVRIWKDSSFQVLPLTLDALEAQDAELSKIKDAMENTNATHDIHVTSFPLFMHAQLRGSEHQMNSIKLCMKMQADNHMKVNSIIRKVYMCEKFKEFSEIAERTPSFMNTANARIPFFDGISNSVKNIMLNEIAKASDDTCELLQYNEDRHNEIGKVIAVNMGVNMQPAFTWAKPFSLIKTEDLPQAQQDAVKYYNEQRREGDVMLECINFIRIVLKARVKISVTDWASEPAVLDSVGSLRIAAIELIRTLKKL